MDIKMIKAVDRDYEVLKSLIDPEEASADIQAELKDKSDNIYSVFYKEDLVGMVQAEEGKEAYIYVYINKEYRNLSIGKEALKQAEEVVVSEKTNYIMTSYQLDQEYSKAFAVKYGYKRQFSSAFMQYSGSTFELGNLPIRAYKDEDYYETHQLSAIAFHEMRVSVGDFPNSKVEASTEEMRKIWDKYAHMRLVYTKGDEILAYARFFGNEIATLSVKSSYQGQGIGRNFMKYVTNKLLLEGHETVDLYCVVGNKARYLYEDLGYVEKYTSDYAVKYIKENS